MVKAPARPEGGCREEDVREALGRVLRSTSFSGSPRLSQFLRHTVERTLEGDLSDLKEVCIGVAVFGKAASYDPKDEPIVRVEARRLRARLEDYYTTDGAADPVRIHLPKGGYQAQFEELTPLISEAPTEPAVDEPASLPEPNEAPLTHTEEQAPVRRLRWPVRAFLLVSVVAFAAGAGAVLLSRLSTPKPLHFGHVAPLTSYPGNKLQPAISHDGRQLAFVWNGEKGDNYDIYVKLLDLGAPVRLTLDPAHDLAPQWAPDDRFISFIRVTETGMSVYVIPALGGAERKVADLQMRSAWKYDALQVQVGSGAAWTTDGSALIVTDDEDSAHDMAAIYTIPLDGSPRRRISSPPSLVHDFDAAIAHHGRSIAFVRETSNSSGDLFLSDLDGGHLRQVTFDRMRIRGVAWSADDRSLIFASNRGGADELWQISAKGGTPERINARGYEITYPSLSADGRVLAYTSTAQNSNLWRVPIAAGGTATMKPEPLITSAGRNDSPRYSPDGTRIAFISDRSGAWELWVAGSDGRDPRQVTNFGGPMVGTPYWSPDGRQLVFDARPNGRSVIFTVTPGAGAPQPIIQDEFENKKPSWSRDGLSLYYTSNRNGPSQLWRSGLHGEHPTRLTTEICNDSAESTDGRYIYFQSDRSGIYRLPVGGGHAELIKELDDVYPSRYFDVSDHIYFLDQESVPRVIRQYDPQTGKVSVVGTISGQLVYGTPSLSVSPDHRFILFAQQDSSSSEIMGLRQ